MHHLPPRIMVYTKDIMNITGKGERTARRMLFKVKKHYNKKRGEMVTVDEFCRFTGWPEEKIIHFLK